jgi:hypothetical protein
MHPAPMLLSLRGLGAEVSTPTPLEKRSTEAAQLQLRHRIERLRAGGDNADGRLNERYAEHEQSMWSEFGDFTDWMK